MNILDCPNLRLAIRIAVAQRYKIRRQVSRLWAVFLTFSAGAALCWFIFEGGARPIVVVVAKFLIKFYVDFCVLVCVFVCICVCPVPIRS